MDRLAFQDGENASPGMVTVDLVFTAGTSGAVPTSFTLANYISGVTKSTNDYVVTFQDSYFMYVNGFGHIIQATPDNTAAWTVKVTAASVTGTTSTVTLSPYNVSGTAQPLATGDELHFSFRLCRLNPNT